LYGNAHSRAAANDTSQICLHLRATVSAVAAGDRLELSRDHLAITARKGAHWPADRCQCLPIRGRGPIAQPRAETEEDDAMHTIEIQDYARQLLEAHGAKAIAEAAQRAAACEKAGDKEHAQTWRRVEAALLLMHGPRQG
jgi:hypothetical protein